MPTGRPRKTKSAPIKAARQPLGDPPQSVLDNALALEKWHEWSSDDCWGRWLTKADAAALALCCRTWADHELACRKLEEEGVIIEGRNGEAVKNPWAQIQNSTRGRMIRLFGELGGLPATRRGRFDPEEVSGLDDEDEFA